MAEIPRQNPTTEATTPEAELQVNPYKLALAQTHVMPNENAGAAYLKGGMEGHRAYFQDREQLGKLKRE